MPSTPEARKSSRAPRKRTRRRLLWLALALLLLLILFAVRPVQEHMRAAGLLLRVSDRHDHGWLAQFETNPVTTRNLDLPGGAEPIPARLYVPVGVRHPAPIVVMHGVHYLGIDEPRLVNFARALSSRGFLVLTPYLADLADYQVTLRTAETIGLAVEELKRISGAKKVAVLGLSFSGGMALMTDADPRFAPDISVIGALGSHDDLGRVLRYFATNHAEGPHGEQFSVPAHEYGALVGIYEHPEALFAPEDVEQARITLRYHLHEDDARSREEAAKLSPQGRRAMQELFDHRMDMMAPVIVKYVDEHAEELTAISPHPLLSRVTAPVYLLAGSEDNIVPPTETLWLDHDLPPQVTGHTLITPVFSHLDPSGGTLRRRLELIRWMTQFLQEASRDRAAVSY